MDRLGREPEEQRSPSTCPETGQGVASQEAEWCRARWGAEAGRGTGAGRAVSALRAMGATGGVLKQKKGQACVVCGLERRCLQSAPELDPASII